MEDSHNKDDQIRILRYLKAEGFPVAHEDVATLSPFATANSSASVATSSTLWQCLSRLPHRYSTERR